MITPRHAVLLLLFAFGLNAMLAVTSAIRGGFGGYFSAVCHAVTSAFVLIVLRRVYRATKEDDDGHGKG